jgi:REP element-mobilizing transposase RayT
MKATNLFNEKYRIECERLQGFDYGTDGAYLITLRSHKFQRNFSKVYNAEAHLTTLGKIIEEELEKTAGLRTYATVTEWMIMPDHVHLVVFIHKNSDGPEHLAAKGSHLYFPEGYANKFGPQRENLASVIRGIKSAVTSRAKKAGLKHPVWQSNFYEHIIRNEIELKALVKYIRENPAAWEKKNAFPDRLS